MRKTFILFALGSIHLLGCGDSKSSGVATDALNGTWAHSGLAACNHTTAEAIASKSSTSIGSSLAIDNGLFKISAAFEGCTVTAEHTVTSLTSSELSARLDAISSSGNCGKSGGGRTAVNGETTVYTYTLDGTVLKLVRKVEDQEACTFYVKS